MIIERHDFDGDDLAAVPTNDNGRGDPRARRVPRHVGRGHTGVLLALAGTTPRRFRESSTCPRCGWPGA